ncbi:MAG: hypothetical protein ACT6RZ_02135 [Methylophilus sp.]|uniref:hypothetical protein n=1 Tax=Methylophilus sp. TaxID=29541 RepID=UPI004036B942
MQLLKRETLTTLISVSVSTGAIVAAALAIMGISLVAILLAGVVSSHGEIHEGHYNFLDATNEPLADEQLPPQTNDQLKPIPETHYIHAIYRSNSNQTVPPIEYPEKFLYDVRFKMSKGKVHNVFAWTNKLLSNSLTQ